MDKVSIRVINNLCLGFILLLISTTDIVAQNNPLLKSWSSTAFFYSPVTIAPSSSNVGSTTIGYGFGIQKNIFSITNNVSFSLGVIPTLTYTHIFHPGQFGIKLPIDFSLNLGAGSTYKSNRTIGLVLAIGIDPTFIASIRDNTNKNTTELIQNIKIGFRVFKAKSNLLNEYSLRFFRLPNESNSDAYNLTLLSFTWTRFINNYD